MAAARHFVSGRVGRLLLCVLVVVAGGAARADAAIFINADAAGVRGYIQVKVVATTDIKTAYVGEDVDGAFEPIVTTDLPYWRDDPDHGPIGARFLDRLVRWRCDRLERDLLVAGRRPDGIVEIASFSVRTPSCRNRLTLTVPRRVAQGGVVRARIRDTWGTGLTSARVCFLGDCREVAFADGEDRRVVRFRAGWRGYRQVKLRAPAQRIEQPIAVGVRPRPSAASGPTILTTGDSLMQSVEAILQDRLFRDANVVSDVRVGAALSKVLVADWRKLARRQVAEHQPSATVIFLGTNDFFAMRTPAGAEVDCCGEQWIAEYARRARKVMRIYAQDGAGAVLWLTVPAARDERRNPPARAVNTALRRAAIGLPAVSVLPIDKVFTPGMRFRESMEYRGRTVDVRETDGIHLSVAGARIAAAMVIEALRGVGVLGR